MLSILNYIDYRKFIRDFYAEKKRCSAFSWRDFATRAGYTSPVFLKLVSEGKNGLSRKAVQRVAKALDLEGYELDYFQNLVEFNQAHRDADRKKAYETMRDIATSHKVQTLDNIHYEYFSSWVYPVIREIASTLPGADNLEIAKHCVPKITIAEINKALKFLSEHGLLKPDHEGNLKMTEKIISTGQQAIADLSIRNYHRQMSSLALDALDTIPPTERDFSALTLGLTENAYKQILAEILEFRRKALAIATKTQETDRVYQLNLQLFPLSLPLSEKKKQEL